MKITATEAYAKLEKLANNQQTFQFALSPKGSLLINREKSFEILDFMVYWNGQYFKRDLLEVLTNFELPENGAFLCSYGKRKFVAARPDGSYEYSTAKKQLGEDFSLVMYIRFDERIVILVADGKFAKEASLVTLSDTPSNKVFAAAVLYNAISARDKVAADTLLQEKDEEANDGEEA